MNIKLRNVHKYEGKDIINESDYMGTEIIPWGKINKLGVKRTSVIV